MTSPSLEKKIVSSALKSRAAFTRIEAAYKFEETYTPYTNLLLKLTAKYYDKDSEATNVDRDVLEGWIKQDIPAKNQELYINYLRECSGVDVSAINVADLVLESKRKFLGNKLAAALLENNQKAIEDLKDKYDSLEIADEGEEEESFSGESVQQLLDSNESSGDARIKLLPKRLDELCKGRARRGHHIVLFARPETGKTALTLTLAYGFALQGLTTLIFGNEEPVADTRMRAMCCFTGMTEEQLKAEPSRAQELLDKRGWRHVRFIPLHPGTPKQIDSYIEKYGADCAIVDQIRNLYVGAETRVNQLEMAATSMRNIGKKRNCLMVSVTQAGDSADNKLVLEMGDIDFSNCLGKGQLVRMFDGSIKSIENIAIGEQVMGMDSTPRTVTKIGSGVAPLYRVVQKDGKEYVVNDKHILTLKKTTKFNWIAPKGSVVDLPLKFVQDNPSSRLHVKGISVGVEHKDKVLPIDPYILGLWLTDGDKDGPSFTSKDIILRDIVNKYAEHLGLGFHCRHDNRDGCYYFRIKGVKHGDNPILNTMRGLGIVNNKHIPALYMTGSREQRLRLLAGIIDGDGFLSRKTNNNSYEISCSRFQDQIQNLCWSLGYKATMVGTNRIYVSGKLSDIPCQLRRKQYHIDSTKDVLCSTIESIEHLGVGEYHGITVDGDQRYVLGNYVVTHNTGIPATADLMAGMGVNKEYEANGMRVISTPKNKIGGVHGNFPTKINTSISRVEDM